MVFEMDVDCEEALGGECARLFRRLADVSTQHPPQCTTDSDFRPGRSVSSQEADCQMDVQATERPGLPRFRHCIQGQGLHRQWEWVPVCTERSEWNATVAVSQGGGSTARFAVPQQSIEFRDRFKCSHRQARGYGSGDLWSPGSVNPSRTWQRKAICLECCHGRRSLEVAGDCRARWSYPIVDR